MKKVSLRELVADKIIFSILIAMYYWMWARNDWKDYYTTVQNVIFAFSFYYFVSRAIRVNLWRCDAICLKISVAAFIVIGFTCAVGRMVLTTEIIGYGLMAALILISVVRTIIFYLMDKKGL